MSYFLRNGVDSATGTANQVLVNGVVALQRGAVTFSLPQSIHTAGTPQFNSLGLGAAAIAGVGSLRQVATTGLAVLFQTAGTEAWQVGPNVGTTGLDTTWGLQSGTFGATPVMQIAVTGAGAGSATFSVPAIVTSIKTGNPSGGTALPWKLGSKVAAAVVLDAANYVEIDINGVAIKLAIVT